jgi:5-methyltetrahydropteroyltriglutamate--homocysteine methyltransferase
MKRSTERILTTHCGSLPRPKDMLDLMKARAGGPPMDAIAYERTVRRAVADIVRQQTDHGIDVVTDGEQGKTGFFAYVNDRLDGFEPRPDRAFSMFESEVRDFPEYYQDYFSQAMLGGTVVKTVPLVCVGPVSYRGHDAVRRDIDNLKAALGGLSPTEVFMPSIAPSGVGSNEYYRSDEEYLYAMADAMRTEYQAIVDAGFLVQIDDPFLTDVLSYSELDERERRRTAEMYVGAINSALRGIPSDRIRFHTCYGINEGPRVHDAPLKDLVDLMLKINADAYSFEAANARHEHEYHV